LASGRKFVPTYRACALWFPRDLALLLPALKDGDSPNRDRRSDTSQIENLNRSSDGPTDKFPDYLKEKVTLIYRFASY
jgi:hypothetical protein